MSLHMSLLSIKYIYFCMSTFTFLCLLIHHGVWSEFDYHVFKSIIGTCQRIYQYVCSNKLLIRNLFYQLAVRVVSWDFGRPEHFWILNHQREGLYLSWWNISKKQLCLRLFYRNNVLHGKYTQWYEDGQIKTIDFYRNGYREGESKTWFRNGQIARSQFYQDGLLKGFPTLWNYDGSFFYMNTLHKSDS